MCFRVSEESLSPARRVMLPIAMRESDSLVLNLHELNAFFLRDHSLLSTINVLRSVIAAAAQVSFIAGRR
jgi:hypothetical protein